MSWVTFVFCNLCTGILSIILARKKQRPALRWFLLTIPLGVLALFLLLALPPASPNQGDKADPGNSAP